MPPTSKRQRVQFKERTELLDFLLEVAAMTSETLDLDRLLPAVADYIQRVIPHDVFAILLYNERQHGLKIRYARGHRDEVVRNLVIPVGEGITGGAAASRHAVVVNDVQSDPRYLPTLDAVRSELAVPMFARGKLVGVDAPQRVQRKRYISSAAAGCPRFGIHRQRAAPSPRAHAEPYVTHPCATLQ